MLGELGVGGMGRVIEVQDLRLNRKVAVKSVRMDLPDRNLPGQLLEREAQITGGLEHPNIIPVYDAGREPGVGPYYIMRVQRQPTLQQVLRDLKSGDPEAAREYPMGRLLRLFVQVCRAVDFAHVNRIVHCDLKPANILLGDFGEVLVVDWGFAQRMGETPPQRGGTPGYMAPEQLDPDPTRLDGRADVFALGAMLYELLSLRKAFPLATFETMLQAIQRGEPPVTLGAAPRTLAPGRVPPELDEICLRCLELKPALRYQTARALADDLETFLEGTKEKERRLLHATELTAQGDDLAASYEEMLLSRPERAAELVELRRAIEPWQDSDAKQELWDALDRNAVLDGLSIRTFQAAVSAYEHALEEVPSHGPARRGLARLFQREAERARERRDSFNRIYFEGLAHQHDDGSLATSLPRDGSIRVECNPPGARVALRALVEQRRRLEPTGDLPPQPAPIQLSPVEPGPYLLEMDVPGGAPVRCPVLIRPGVLARVKIELAEARQRTEGEVFIPGGPALLGGHESSLLGPELTEVEVPSFFLSEAPVTFAEYLEFLEALYRAAPERAEELLPAASDGSLYWQWDGSDFIPAQAALWGESAVELLFLPAVGVTYEGALAYAKWRAKKSGLPYRLPNELEWEKAARGVDGRAYPWGDHFDASFCKMRRSRRGPPLPETSRAFAADVSPYGVRDMAGGVADWVVYGDGLVAPPDPATVITRGGAWTDEAADCHGGARRVYWTSERSERIGFRLARRPTPP
jgi:serine/threonine-protein kinase